MNMKKILLTGALALVVIGCVIAAGCTSTTPQTGTADSITGIWSTTFTSAGENVDGTIIVHSNGAGYINLNYENGISKAIAFTWAKNADGTFAIQTSDGKACTWTLNSAKDKITSSSGRTFIKKFAENSDATKIVGVWLQNNTTHLTTFNADGSGTVYKGEGKEMSKFTWSIPEAGKIKVQFISGTATSTGENLAGKESILIYDADKGTLTNTESGTVRVRPMESMDGFTIIRFSTEPIVGQWITQYPLNGKTSDAVLTLRNDGQGYWMLLGDDAGIQVTTVSKDTWKKTGENTYLLSSSKGNSYETTYDSAKDTLTTVKDSQVKNTYSRLDPLVGFWYGPASSGNGGKTSTLFKPDGTGVVTVSYGDLGTAKLYTATWKKNADGIYAANFSSGENRIYTLDPSGLTVSSSGGSVKHKAFLDASFLVSVVGPWYNKDKDAMAVFSADGTGFVKSQRIFPFTWKLTDIGKFIVTYTDGTADDGSSLKGKTFEWAYDRDNNVFSTSKGTTYIRPTGDIEGKVSFN